VRNYWLKAFQTIVILLLIFLSVSTFIPQITEFPQGKYPGTNALIQFLQLDHFYNSPINILLWVILTLSIFGSILLKDTQPLIQKILHLLLALIFITIGIEKSINHRYLIPIKEGEEIQFSRFAGTGQDDIQLKLLQFEILYHSDNQTPKAFISRFLLNNQDSVQLAVNQPLALGNFRLYQNSYDRQIFILLMVDQNTFRMSIGDSLILTNKTFKLAEFNPVAGIARIIYDAKSYYLETNQPCKIEDYHFTIKPAESCYRSIIEAVEIRGTKALLVFCLLYLISLASVFWFPKSIRQKQGSA